jgi:tetratricopeptide (TPR) repeat protein
VYLARHSDGARVASLQEAYQLVGSANGDRKKLQQAKLLLDRVLTEDPMNPVALFLRGWSFQQSGQPQDAINTYETLHPRISELSGFAHYNEAILLDALNRPDEALAHFQKAVADNVSLGEAWRRMIALLVRTGDMDGAKEATEDALMILPTDPAILEFKKQLGIQNR